VAGWLLLGLAGLVTAFGPWALASENERAAGQAEAAGAKAGDSRAIDTLIYANDLLFIQVFDVEQLTHEYRVGPSGMLAFPLLADPVRAAGLTPEQLEKELAQKCKEAGVLGHPQITITIRESRVHAVAIAGAVRNPQVYPVFGRITLMDVITQAGGPSEDAGLTVTVTRGEVARRVLAAEVGGGTAAGPNPSIPPTVTVGLQKLLETGDPSLNVDVFPGDRVTVQRAGVVYVMGAVNAPGGYLLTEARQEMTVLKALALAGSLKSIAKSSKSLILRPNPAAPGGRELIHLDLNAMQRGRVPDQPLLASDILFVPDSAALKALHKSAEVAANTAGLAVVYK
jgi:polysaccharide export outer membrane protein